MANQSSSSGRLTASVHISSDVVYDEYCEVCSEDGKYLEADGFCVDCEDYLCKKCFEGHMRNRASRDHVLQDKTQMLHHKPSSSVAIPSIGTCTEKCAFHPDRLVEYYCRNDRSVGCSVCMTMNHRLCNNVDHIPDLAAQLLDSQVYKQFTDTLSDLKSKSQSVIKSTKENVAKAEQWFCDTANMLKELRINTNEAFDKFEEDLKDKTRTIKSADLKKMQDISDTGQTVFEEVKKISAELQSLQVKNQLGQLFIQIIQLEDNVDTLHKLIAEADADNSVTAYTFESDSQVQKILKDPTSIGKLSVHATARPKLSPSTSKPVLKNTPGQSPNVQTPAPTTGAHITNSTTPPALKKSFTQSFAAQSAVTATAAPKANSSSSPVLDDLSEQPPAAQFRANAVIIANSATLPILKTITGQPLAAQLTTTVNATPMVNTTLTPLLGPSTQPPVAQSATTTTTTTTAAPIAKNPKHMKAAFVDDIKVRTERDTDCRINGSALLPGNKIILVDYSNTKIKLLNLQMAEVISEQLTSSKPWDITSITADQVAVTLPSSRKIVFVKVTDTLTTEKEMAVAGDCRAILHNAGKLIVAFKDPKKIEIMTLDGTVERQIEQPGLFKFPSNMALSLDCKTIYVADCEGHCVKRITLEGAVEAEYRDKELVTPRGLTVDQHDRVLVCGERSRNIHLLLTPDLTKVKVLVNTLDCPQSLSDCHDTGKLFVGMWSDNLKVYQLS